MDIIPLNGCLLVKLTGAYEFVASPDKKYDTKTSGIVVAADDIADIALLNHKVFFEEYKDGTIVDIDGVKHAFIKREDVRGYQHA
jgi:co-chaperonin GroES (HSP10)